MHAKISCSTVYILARGTGVCQLIMESLATMQALAGAEGLEKRVQVKTYDPLSAEFDESCVMTRDAMEYWTRGRAENPEWHAARHGRVTASKVGAIMAACRGGNQRSATKIGAMQNLAKDMVAPSTLKPTEAMVHGNKNEGQGIVAYAKLLDKDEHVVVGHGLYVHPEHTWLACSPDGVYMKNECMMKTVDGSWLYCDCLPRYRKRLVEVKCPFSKKDSGSYDDPNFYLKKKGDGYELNMKSSEGRQYYYQIQTNLAILDLKECDLVVWSPRETAVARVTRQSAEDEANMIDTCRNFWHTYVERLVDPGLFRPVEELPETLGAIVSDAEKVMEGIVARLKENISRKRQLTDSSDLTTAKKPCLDGDDGDL